jgi:hypothetical protein
MEPQSVDQPLEFVIILARGSRRTKPPGTFELGSDRDEHAGN